MIWVLAIDTFARFAQLITGTPAARASWPAPHSITTMAAVRARPTGEYLTRLFMTSSSVSINNNRATVGSFHLHMRKPLLNRLLFRSSHGRSVRSTEVGAAPVSPCCDPTTGTRDRTGPAVVLARHWRGSLDTFDAKDLVGQCAHHPGDCGTGLIVAVGLAVVCASED